MAILLLFLGICVQIYVEILKDEGHVTEEHGAFIEDAEGADPDVIVDVGDMYFEQRNTDLPRGTLEVEAGDVIRFEHVGAVAHTVTIDHFGIDEVIRPEESYTFKVLRPIDEVFVNCRFHVGHDAQMKVVGEPVEGPTGAENNGMQNVGVGDDEFEVAPVRSKDDAVEQLEYQEVDGIKVFELSADPIRWDYGNGDLVNSWGYNEQLPGPEIRVTEGDDVRIEFTNNLPVATTVHWHGVDLVNEADGVPGVTQDPVEPGESFVYEFTAEPAGTRFYHTHGSHHGDEGEQMMMGLSGAFIIEPADHEEPDVDRTLVLTERLSQNIFPINGAIYPAIPPIRVEEGDVVRVRMINAGVSEFHPMHLHGHQFDVVAVDGNPVPAGTELTRNVETLHPGETVDIQFVADNPGHWLFHCHELNHAANGMVMEVVYDSI